MLCVALTLMLEGAKYIYQNNQLLGVCGDSIEWHFENQWLPGGCIATLNHITLFVVWGERSWIVT